MFDVITKDEFEQASGVAAVPTLGRVGVTPEDIRPDEECFNCDSCGWCPTPNNCAWSRTCPKCKQPPKAFCVASDGRITGLHAERW